MHPRNPYSSPPDFRALAEAYPDLRQFLTQVPLGVTVDFQDEAALRCLTKALLLKDFGLSLELPQDRLCPPVPNRLNYVLWLQDILSTSHDSAAANVPVLGVDVGTGASVIYPLLGCKMSPMWRFYATEIDEQSVQCAMVNVRANSMQHRIEVIRVSPNDSIFPDTVFITGTTIAFTMCNPPFYGSREEVQNSAEAKELGPSAVCTGADTEMITPGGEVAFIGQMVRESLRLGTRCRWYTSMLGKMASLTEIVAQLRLAKIDNYAVTEFVQGRTRRWAIAWSFGDIHLPDDITRFHNPALQNIMPPRNTLHQSFAQLMSAADAVNALSEVLQDIEGVVSQAEDREPYCMVVQAAGNTWSRAARRRKLATMDVTPSDQSQPDSPALTCRIRCLPAKQSDRPHAASEHVTMEFNWVRGTDRGLFESFVSHVARKVETFAKRSDGEAGYGQA